MKSIRLDDLKDAHLGKIGIPKRDAYEQELKLEILSEQIKQLRKERKLSQEALSQLAGIEKSQISKIEEGMCNITFETIIKLFNALKAQINFSIYKER